MSAKISYFNPPVTNRIPSKEVSVYEVYQMILGENENINLKELTESLRAIEDKDERSRFKRERLPFVTFGGIFSERKKEKLSQASGLLILDFDNLEEIQIEALKQDLASDENLNPILLFRSPSGNGLKVVVPVKEGISGNEDFRQGILSAENYFLKTYDLILDGSGKDINRNCFLCYDPDAIYQEQRGEGFDVEKWEPQERPRQERYLGRDSEGNKIYDSAINDYDRAERAIEDIESSGIDITSNYEDWVRIGFALGNLGEMGREFFHRVSKNYSGYRPEETDRQFDNSLNDGGIGLNTLFQIAKERGVHLRPSFENMPERTSLRTENQPQPTEQNQKPKKTTFPELLKPMTESDIRKWETSVPDSLRTGYRVGNEKIGFSELLIPSAKLTGIAGPTNHGKSLVLMNLLLNSAKMNPDKRFILLTYEENSETITEYLLNIYIDNLNLTKGEEDISNRLRLKEYFRGDESKLNGDIRSEFELRKGLFFKNYIENGRILIKYIESDSDELCQALEYISAPENRIGGVFVDYFQCINPSGDMMKKTRQEALKSICFQLKDTANRTGLPIVLGAQFNQEVVSPTDLLITKVGEAGDISRILSELWGIWNLSKDVGRDLKSEQEKKVESLNNQLNEMKYDNWETGIYLKVLKSRLIESGKETILRLRGLNGKIYSNLSKDRFPQELKNDWEQLKIQ